MKFFAVLKFASLKLHFSNSDWLKSFSAKELLEKSQGEPLFELAFALALYTGLRPNELKTARIDGEFIVAENSKRKRKGKTTARTVEYKRIYICDRLRAYLVDGLPKLPTPQLLRRRMKKALPNHILKDLRKTFNSRCKELGVSDHARKHFMGHSLGKIDGTYTEFSTEYLLLEGKKLNNWYLSQNWPIFLKLLCFKRKKTAVFHRFFYKKPPFWSRRRGS